MKFPFDKQTTLLFNYRELSKSDRENRYRKSNLAIKNGYEEIANPLVSGYGKWGKKGYKPEYQRHTEDSLKTVKILLDRGADIDVKTKNGSIEDLISEMKKSDLEFIVDFTNEVDLLFDLYR